MNLVTYTRSLISGLGLRVRDLHKRLTAVEYKTRTLAAHTTVSKKGTNGMVREILYYRADQTLIASSLLDVVAMQNGLTRYERTVNHYGTDGTTLLRVERYSITESVDGTITESLVSAT